MPPYLEHEKIRKKFTSDKKILRLRRQVPPVWIARMIMRAYALESSNKMIRRIIGRPSLKTSLTQAYYAVWRLFYGNVFPIDLNGLKILFHDPGSPENYLTSFTGFLYEHSVIMHLKHILKQYDSPTFLDVGAHYGYYAVCMSKLGGPSSRVFSFEPNSGYFKILLTNVRLNKLRNVVTYRIALSDKKKRVVLETSDSFRSSGFVQERRKMRPLRPSDSLIDQHVIAISFDELAQATGISPDIVKIDVHGAEGNVIAGMQNALKKNITHLYCELHSEMSNGYSARDIVNTLQDAGMETLEFRRFRYKNGRFIKIPEDLFSGTWKDRMIYARK